MTERERHEIRPDADLDDPEIDRSRGGPPPEHTEAERPTDQAIINEERELESGEENVV